MYTNCNFPLQNCEMTGRMFSNFSEHLGNSATLLFLDLYIIYIVKFKSVFPGKASNNRVSLSSLLTDYILSFVQFLQNVARAVIIHCLWYPKDQLLSPLPETKERRKMVMLLPELEFEPASFRFPVWS